MLAEAVVELLPDIRRFSKKLRTDLDQIDRAVERFSRGTESELGKIGTAGERSFDRVTRSSENANEKILIGWRRTATGIEQIFRDSEGFITKRTRQTLEDVNREFAREFEKMSAKARIESERTGNEINTRIGGAIRNVARQAAGTVLTPGFDSRQISAAIVQANQLGAVLSTLGIGALAGQAGIGGVVSLLGAIGELSGSLALIPAAGAAATVAIGTLTIGMVGLGDVITEDDPTKYAEALGKLPPAAQDVVRAIRDIIPEAERLQDSIQGALFAGLDDQIRSIADVLMPRLRVELTDVAAQFNDIAFEVAKFIRSSRTMSDITRTIDRTSDSIDILTSAVQPLLQAFRDVVAVGATFLPRVTGELSAAALEFANFIEQARASGALAEFIGNGIESFKDLIAVIGNVGRIFNATFTAAETAGTSFLGTLRDITDQFADFLSGARGQEILISLIQSGSRAASALLPLLEQVASVIALQIAPLLADIGTTVLPSVTRVIDGIGRALVVAGPGIIAFVDGFGGLLDTLVRGGVIDALGELVRVLGTELGGALTTIAPTLGKLIDTLAGELAGLLPDLLPVVADLAVGFGNLVIAALPLLGIISDIASSVWLPTITRALGVLAPAVTKLADGISSALVPILPRLAEEFGKLVDALAPVADDVAQALVDMFIDLAPLLPDLIENMTALIKVVAPLVKLLATIASGATSLVSGFDGLVKSVTGLNDAFAGVGTGQLIFELTNPIGAVSGLQRSVNGLVDIMHGEYPDATRSFVDNTKKLGEGSRVTIDELTTRFRDGLGTILGNLTSTAPMLTDIFLRELGTMRDGSRNIFGEILATITDHFGRMEQTIADHTFGISDAVDRAWQRVNESTSRAFAETDARVAEGITNVGAEINRLPGIFQSGLDAVRDIAESGGRSIVNGIITGMRQREQAVREAAAAIMRAIRDFLPGSPAKRGPFSGRGWTPYRGAALVEGFADGMLRSMSEVRRAAEMLAGATALQLPSASSVSVAGLVSSTLARGAVDTAQTIDRMTTTADAPVRLLTPPTAPDGSLSGVAGGGVGELNVEVYIGDEKINDLITDVVADHDRSLKRAVTTGSRRRP